MRISLLFVFILLSTMLGAQGWPGIVVPTRDQFLAAGATPYKGPPGLWVSRQKGEDALVLGAKIVIYSTEGEFKSMTLSFEPIWPGSFANFTLPLADRKALFDSGQLPELPSFLKDWGLGWPSTARQWLENVEPPGGWFEPSPSEDNTLIPSYHGGPSRHLGSEGAVILVSKDDPHYTLTFNLDEVDATGPDVPFALHSVTLKIHPEPQVEGNSGPFQDPRRSSIDDEQRSALALSAILMEQNHEGHETLDSRIYQRDQENELKLLARDWGIRSREDLLAMLEKLDQGLHGKSYQELSALLDANQGVEPRKLSEILHLSESRASRLLFVAATRADLGPQGIHAWDEGRRVALARWGYHVGFLTQGEAWEVVMTTWHKLDGQYRSWNDYYYHYLAGRAFWAASFENDWGKLVTGLRAWGKLFWNREGVWNSPWPHADQVTTPDHSPWSLLYDPTAEAHSLYDLLEASDARLDTDYGLETAKNHLKWAASRTPDYALVTHAQIRLALGTAKNDEALLLAQNAVQRRPELALVWFDLGQALEAADPKGGVEAAYSKAIEIDPNYFEALDGMGQLRLNAGDWKGAVDWLERAKATIPDRTTEDEGNFFYRLAFTYNRTGQYKKALPLVEELLRLYPVAAVQFEAGICYYSLGENWWPQARKAFQEAKAKGHALPPGIERWLAQSK